MRTVTAFSTPTEAHLARSKLESAGIEAVIRDENFVTFNWLGSNAIGGVRLDVADEDFASAREILALPPPEAGLLRCPHCGSFDTHVRPLDLFGAVCVVFKLPVPLRWITVDCHSCGKSFGAHIAGAKD